MFWLEIECIKYIESISSDQPVLLDFFAEWRGPCNMMKPILENLKKEMGNKVTILKIDIDKNQKLAVRDSIQSVPTLILVKQGKIA